eukprot:12735445-Alexandrium_andersonii.AAC.1
MKDLADAISFRRFCKSFRYSMTSGWENKYVCNWRAVLWQLAPCAPCAFRRPAPSIGPMATQNTNCAPCKATTVKEQ